MGSPGDREAAWQDAFSKLESKFDLLQHENKLLKRGLLVCLVLFAVAGLTAANAAKDTKEVEAQKFVLIDDKGKSRAYLTLEDGAAKLILQDEQQRNRVLMVAHSSESAIALLGEDGSPMLTLGNSNKGSSLITARSAKGKGLFALQVSNESTVLYCNDSNGKRRVAILVDDSDALLHFRDPSQVLRVVQGTSKKEGVGMSIFDEKDQLRIGIGSNERGHGIELTGAKDQTRLGIGIKSNDDPYFKMYDASGKIKFKVPE